MIRGGGGGGGHTEMQFTNAGVLPRVNREMLTVNCHKYIYF